MRCSGLAIASLLFFVPWVAAADDWDELAKIQDRYYYLDGGPLARVDCAVRVPVLNALLDDARGALSRSPVEIRDTLDDFRVAFDAEAGLSFAEPRLEMIASDSTGMTDPEAFREGAAALEQDFARLIGNVEQMLVGILGGYVRPDRKEFSDVQVTRENEKIHVRYRRAGSDVTATIEPGRRHSRSASTAGTLDLVERFEPGREKSRLASATMLMKQPMQETKMEIKVEYQELAGLDFPAVVATRSHIRSRDGFEQSSEFAIRLEGCRLP